MIGKAFGRLVLPGSRMMLLCGSARADVSAPPVSPTVSAVVAKG